MTHPANQDKHGNDVSLFVEEAIREMRKDERVQKVLCETFQSGRLQVWFTDRHVYGDVIRTARELGYEIAYGWTRPETLLPEDVTSVDDAGIGYAEFVPINNHGHETYDRQTITP